MLLGILFGIPFSDTWVPVSGFLIAADEAVLSEKDAGLPRLAGFQSPFAYTGRK